MARSNLTFDPDITRDRDAAYWAAALAVAVRNHDDDRIDLARRKLRLLGCPLDVIRPAKPKEASRGQ
jgi:hypothetical protein